MPAYAADGRVLLMKKFGGILLIVLGILGIAIGLEYRSNGLSIRTHRRRNYRSCLWHGASRAEDHPA